MMICFKKPSKSICSKVVNADLFEQVLLLHNNVIVTWNHMISLEGDGQVLNVFKCFHCKSLSSYTLNLILSSTSTSENSKLIDFRTLITPSGSVRLLEFSESAPQL